MIDFYGFLKDNPRACEVQQINPEKKQAFFLSHQERPKKWLELLSFLQSNYSSIYLDIKLIWDGENFYRISLEITEDRQVIIKPPCWLIFEDSYIEVLSESAFDRCYREIDEEDI